MLQLQANPNKKKYLKKIKHNKNTEKKTKKNAY